MLHYYLAVLCIILHTSSSAWALVQQEGICGPEREAANECVDPAYSGSFPYFEGTENNSSESSDATERIAAPKGRPEPDIEEHHSSRVRKDAGKSSVEPSSPEETGFVVHFFWGRGCPHCKEEKEFLNTVQAKYPRMKIIDYEVWYDKEHAALLSKMAAAYGITTAGVPVTFIGKNSVIGFSRHSKKELSAFFQECSLRQCPDPADIMSGSALIAKAPAVSGESQAGDVECTEKGKAVYIPWIGNLDSSQMSLPVITVVIAGLDSFNPCAFFVLFSLLGLLIHAKSRTKMFLIGSVFVFFSGFIYFLFMSAWLNLFLVMGQVDLITKCAGSVAVVIAVINIKDFFLFKKGISLTIPDSAKPKLFDRMRKLLKSTSVVSILIGTAVLAIAANAYELLCTAGFPMVFTRILTLNNLSSAWYYFYLILYNAVYIIPLSIIVILFTVTLGKKQLTEHQGRLLKLVSGAMMLALGGVLLLNPTVLSNAFISFILLIGALIVSLAVAFMTDKLKPS
jgi:glutaredoxin